MLLAACQTPAPIPPPEPVVKTVTVEKPVPVACVQSLPMLPDFVDNDAALNSLTTDFDGTWKGVGLLRGGRGQRDAYIASLRALLAGCAALPGPSM